MDMSILPLAWRIWDSHSEWLLQGSRNRVRPSLSGSKSNAVITPYTTYSLTNAKKKPKECYLYFKCCLYFLVQISHLETQCQSRDIASDENHVGTHLWNSHCRLKYILRIIFIDGRSSWLKSRAYLGDNQKSLKAKMVKNCDDTAR